MIITEEQYNNLLYLYKHLQYKHEKLQDQYSSLQREYEKIEHRIKSELEPRIIEEGRKYDLYVENGSSDICFRNGISGNCNNDCEMFESKEECNEI
jgi:hypothetical protein